MSKCPSRQLSVHLGGELGRFLNNLDDSKNVQRAGRGSTVKSLLSPFLLGQSQWRTRPNDNDAETSSNTQQNVSPTTGISSACGVWALGAFHRLGKAVFPRQVNPTNVDNIATEEEVLVESIERSQPVETAIKATGRRTRTQ